MDESKARNSRHPHGSEYPTADCGLNEAQVRERLKRGQVNAYTRGASAGVPQILIKNICTLFNLINLILFVALFFADSHKNTLFMGVVLSNLLIGTIQEIRAKVSLDKLSLLSSAKATVIRSSNRVKILPEEVVQDDIIIHEAGSQVVADCAILSGECDANESFLTGESAPVAKRTGDTLLSGSFIASGSCVARATAVGSEAYLNTIVSGAKQLKMASSEIMRTLKYIIRIISIAIFPIGAALIFRQINLDGVALNDAIVSVVAALIGMIPEGLMLLTSTVLAVSGLRLSRRGVLTRELHCIEGLARSNVLCLDKTGTLTNGNFEVQHTILLDGTTPEQAAYMLNCLTHSLDADNPTFGAIRAKYHDAAMSCDTQTVHPFSGETKWSGVTLGDGRTIAIGAPEFVMRDMSANLADEVQRNAAQYRVLLLAGTNEPLQTASNKKAELPSAMQAAALILLRDTVRETAAEAMRYFREQKVAVKIISGDNLRTVTEVAARAGVEGYENGVDVSLLDGPEAVAEAANRYTIFSRVSPQDKKTLIEALKAKGNTVAMAGDGVNDALALRAADCSIAMATGSDAAKSVSQFVLTGCDFLALPKVVSEGRRCINNIQSLSSLFLVKTIYSTLLAIAFMLFPFPYPFEPIQLSLISSLTIGIPSFILALQPNFAPVSGSIIKKIFLRALPGGLAVAASIPLMLVLTHSAGFSDDMSSTVCMLVTGFIGLLALFKVCSPFNALRAALFTAMAAGFVCAAIFIPQVLSIAPLTPEILLTTVAPFMAMALMLYMGFYVLFTRVIRI